MASKGTLHATYLHVFCSNWPCTQTLKLTMFPITFSPTAGFHNLEHQISIGGSRGDSLGTHRNSILFRHLIISNYLQLQSERQGLLGFVSDGLASVQLQHQFFQFQLRERLPWAQLHQGPQRIAQHPWLMLPWASQTKIFRWNSPCDGWAAANWKTRAAQSAGTATSARHRASAPSPKRSPGGSPWSAGWVPAVEASPSPRPLGKSWRRASSKKSKNIISS